jgi:hypothetical protein
MTTTIKRTLIFVAVFLATALAVGLVFHPDPGCGVKPEPEPRPTP